MTKLFLTGASGFIGGDFLAAVTKAHPEYAIRALARNTSSAKKIRDAFSSVEIVEGELDDIDTIRNEAADADVTLNLAATNHLSSSTVIYEGASKRSRASFIQISGGTIISQSEIANKIFGNSSDHVYDDLEGPQTVRDIARRFPNRKVDNYLFDISQEESSVRTALVVAPLIYGQGRGPVNQRSIQIPELARVAIERKRAVQIGEGQNTWSTIHVEDLSSLLVRLVEAAVAGEKKEKVWTDSPLWFAEGSAGITFQSLIQRLAKTASEKGLLSSADVEQVSADQMDEVIPHGSAILGTNARLSGKKARQWLGWEPKYDQLESEIDRVVDSEALKPKTH